MLDALPSVTSKKRSVLVVSGTPLPQWTLCTYAKMEKLAVAKSNGALAGVSAPEGHNNETNSCLVNVYNQRVADGCR